MADDKTVQERLYDAFVHRPFGMLEDAALLAPISIILRLDHHFRGRLETAADLRALSDEHAAIALRLLPGIDIPRDPDLASRLVAREIARRRTGT